MTKDLNDRLDDIFGAPTDRELPQTPAAVEYRAKVAQDAGFFQKCGRCNGTGQTRWGTCFRCRGAKGQTFKTSPEARIKARAQAADRKERRVQEGVDAFIAAEPAIWAWINANPTFDFAQSLKAGIVRFGSLTDGQRAAVERLIARDAQKAAERTERAQQAPQVDTAGIDRLKAAFDRARAATAAKASGLTLRNPKITIGGITLSPAGDNSKNPGAIYAKVRGGDYLGKISGGRFFASRECSPEQAEQIGKFVADPAEAAKVYGQETGVCCICNATLRSEWRLKGIGPICAEKFGW